MLYSAITANTMVTPRNIALTLLHSSDVEVTSLSPIVANQASHLLNALSVEEIIQRTIRGYIFKNLQWFRKSTSNEHFTQPTTAKVIQTM
jgi:hypothetical protein